MEKLNVAIADDNERMVDLLSTLVKGDKELELVGQAADGQEIYKIIKKKSRMLCCWILLCLRWMELQSWKR